MVDWKLEVVVVPVADIDRAVSFYRDKAGFNLDHDTRVSEEIRVVQLTPRGSACSIVLGKGIPQAEPGTIKGLQLVVRDIEPARAELVERGVEVSEVQQVDPRDGGTFVFFSDPDGNEWAVQQYRGGN
ncbi:MAG: VOC family protein [Actinomycetota bacterium]|nr:VOC family protein [Actinomycetota bacterium]